MVTLPGEVLDWLASLKNPSTRRARETDFMQWAEHRGRRPIDRASRDDFAEWVALLEEQGYSAQTVARRAGSVRAFYEYSGQWTRPETPARPSVTPVTDDDFARLLVCADPVERLIVELMAANWSAGAISELRARDAEHVRVALAGTSVTAETVAGVLAARPFTSGPAGAPLLYTPMGVPMMPEHVRRAVTRLAARAGISDRVSIPALRARSRSTS